MTDEEERYRPNLGEAFRNWRHSDLPLRTKLRLTARNEWIKIRTMSNCCGHIDEPGC